MLSVTIKRSTAEERSQLLFLGIGLGIVAAVIAFVFGGRVFPAFLAVLAAVALVGAAAHRQIGHDVYLVFSLIAFAIGRVLSPIVVFVMYVVSIGLIGVVLRCIGMNRLKRDFRWCRKQPTMFLESTRPSEESFRRQS